MADEPTETNEQEAKADPQSAVEAPADVGAVADAALDDAQHAASAVKAQIVAAESGEFNLPDFGAKGNSAVGSDIEMLDDVNLRVKVELGRTRMYVEDVLRLNPGSVVELDKPAGDPVDVFVNDRLIARGEVIVVNETFCVRVSEIVDHVEEED